MAARHDRRPERAGARACRRAVRARPAQPARSPPPGPVPCIAADLRADPGAQRGGQYRPAVAAILASIGVAFEIVVLDDGSTDRTAAILAGIADPRLRVISGPHLPAGWSGKQHACAVLARAARHDLMVFTDADVRLTPDALEPDGRLHGRARGGAGQRLPAPGGPELVRAVAAAADPLPAARLPADGDDAPPVWQPDWALAAASCSSPGVPSTSAPAAMPRSAPLCMTGITLPRAFRRAGIMTGLFDATDLASCRMYCDGRARCGPASARTRPKGWRGRFRC